MTTTLDQNEDEKRLDGLEAYISLLKSDIESQTFGFTHKTTLLKMLDGLSGFGKKHFGNVEDNFDKKKVAVDFSLEYALEKIAEQISEDIMIIEKIYHQRINDNWLHNLWDKVFRADAQKIRERLNTADQLAQKALIPALENTALNLGSPHKVFTYLQKNDSVRILPYINVAPIGIPVTALSLDQDLLAIPHEVGHYVFWKSSAVQAIYKDLKKRFKNDKEKNYIIKWLEEIFADVYGCWVSGPSITADFQDLLAKQNKAEFFSIDDTHPISAIRPYIYLTVLKYNFSGWVDPLQERWENIVKMLYPNGNGETLINTINSINFEIPSSQGKNKSKIVNELQEPIDEFLHILGLNKDNWLRSDLKPMLESIPELYKADNINLTDIIDFSSGNLRCITYEEFQNGRKIGKISTTEELLDYLSADNWQTEIARKPWG